MKRTSGLINGKALRDAGMINPLGDKPCGAKDPSARVPEPQHFDCRACHALIVRILEARSPRPSPEPEAKQADLPFMGPSDE